MSHHSVEDIKSESHRLRGSLLDSLADPVTGALRESDQTLIKYHGSYPVTGSARLSSRLPRRRLLSDLMSSTEWVVMGVQGCDFFSFPFKGKA